MRNHLLIESRDNFGRRDGGFCLDLARALAAKGDGVTVLLVQNGVLPARGDAPSRHLAMLVAAGVPVLADRFSLAERAIGEGQLADGIQPASLGIVIDRMIDGWRVLWH